MVQHKVATRVGRCRLTGAQYHQLVRLVESDKMGGKQTHLMFGADYAAMCSKVLGFHITIHTIRRVVRELGMLLKGSRYPERPAKTVLEKKKKIAKKVNALKEFEFHDFSPQVVSRGVNVVLLERVVRHLCTSLGEDYDGLCRQLAD